MYVGGCEGKSVDVLFDLDNWEDIYISSNAYQIRADQDRGNGIIRKRFNLDLDGHAGDEENITDRVALRIPEEWSKATELKYTKLYVGRKNP